MKDKKKAFVTGATGFIGQYLVKELVDRGWQVTALVRTRAGEKKIAHLDLRTVYGDLTKPFSYRIPIDTTHIFHLAAIISHDQKWENKIFAVNLDGTRDLLNKAAKLKNLEQFIHVSTVGIYGTINTNLGNENSTPNPQSPYERSKYQAELLFRNPEYKKIPYTIIRPPVVIGRYDKASPLKTLYRLVKTGCFLPIGNKKIPFQFIYVADLVKGILLVINRPKALNQDFIIAGPIIDFNYLGKKIAQLLNKKVLPGYLPVSVVRTISRFSVWTKPMGLPLPIHPHSLKYLLTNRIFSTNKAERILGFSTKTKLDDTIAETISWYQESEA